MYTFPNDLQKDTHNQILFSSFFFDLTGCPLPGYYGANCCLECKEGHCDNEDGTCLGGKPGFIDPKCNIGKYVRDFFLNQSKFLLCLIFCTS